MRILAIESSCDETAVAIVEDGRRILTDCIASQVALHREYGGVVPEIASRKHIEAIYGLAEQALENTGLTRGELDAVAVTYAPGLIGALLVGVNFAKAAALALDVPLIPVHHIKGHIAANYLAYPDLEPPFLVPCRLRRAHHVRRCRGLYEAAHSRRHARRRGRGVLRQGRTAARHAIPRRVRPLTARRRAETRRAIPCPGRT